MSGESWTPYKHKTPESNKSDGFLAVADRYQRFGCDFYLASYHHFCHLLKDDYEAAQRLLAI